MSTQWFVPTYVSLPVSGFQCACISADQAILYYLHSDGTLFSYVVGSNTLQTVTITGYTGITDCYYDNENAAIIFVWQTSDLKRFSLTSLTEVGTHSTT